jgi:glycosyltransferase involved in cell wall biosynthesis
VARALTVVQLLPALNAGGVERSTLEIGRALVAAGHRSVVISAGGRLLPRLLAEGSEHIDLDIGSKSLRSLLRIPALRQRLRELSPDIVHARSRLPAWLTLAALRGLHPRPPFVTTVHGLNSPGRYSAVMARGERVICVSGTVRDYLLQHYHWLDAESLVVIPRGIDPAEFAPTPGAAEHARTALEAEFPQLCGGRWLTLPGRGTRLKGHAEALHLLAGLAARASDVRLLLMGAAEPGRERYIEELRALAAELGVLDRIAITAPRGELAGVYAASALVLQLSTKPEAFGRTVVEALGLGVPVLGFDHGGVGELLRELYPVGAVPPFDRAALLDAAAALLENAPPVMRFSHYRLADMQRATLDLYAELAPDRPA